MNILQANYGIPFEMPQLQRENPGYVHTHSEPSFQHQMKKNSSQHLLSACVPGHHGRAGVLTSPCFAYEWLSPVQSSRSVFPGHTPTLLLPKVYYSYNSMDLYFLYLVPVLCTEVSTVFDIFLNWRLFWQLINGTEHLQFQNIWHHNIP